MADREKVINGLECCATNRLRREDCEAMDCAYLDLEGHGCIHQLIRDAIALLKAQNDQIIMLERELMELKAQEPKTGHWVDQCCRDFLCSECGHKLVNNNWVRSDGYCHDDLPKYCPECGVKMERGIIQRRFVGEDKIVYPDYNKNI